MKPIIIIKEKNANDKFELTEKELEVLIEQVYAQGFEDGKKTQPNIQWVPTDWGNGKRDVTPTYPHDIYGNPIPYCSGGTASDPRDNRGTLNAEYNDLVYRGWEHREFPKQAEPIPCWLNQTSGQPNPTTKLNNTASSLTGEQ